MTNKNIKWHDVDAKTLICDRCKRQMPMKDRCARCFFWEEDDGDE